MDASPTETEQRGPAMRVRLTALWRPLAVRDFRLLWAGESISVLGDEFYAVAMPWLVLLLTGSSLALGTVLMAASIPRAVLMIGGGAVVDRVPPRIVMLLSNATRAVFVLLLAALVLGHRALLWQLYVLSFLFGIADALFFPAFSAIPSRLLDEGRLPGGNALLQGTAQVSGLIGPAVAGLLVAALAGQTGIGLALLIDGVSFVVAAGALSLMRAGRRTESASSAAALADGEPNEGLAGSIMAGLRYAWRDPVLRVLLMVTAALNVAISGPLNVGIPLLARTRFAHSAVIYGVMLATLSGGSLLGTFLAGSLPRPPRRGLLVIGVAFLLGAGVLLVALSTSLIITIPTFAVMGVAIGFANIILITWLQVRTDPAMLGRVMGLVFFAAFALQPIGLAAAGAIAAVNLTLLLVLSGGAMAAAGASALASKTVREIH